MTETNAVAIKLPAFWAQQPEVWFLQAEAQFHIRKITDDTTKYYHVVLCMGGCVHKIDLFDSIY